MQAVVLHVSPGGADVHSGTQDAPLATIAEALRRIPPGHPATVRLGKGVYREQVTLPAQEGEPEWITLEGREGVIFDGGEPITQWEALEAHPGVYRVRGALSQKIRAYETDYYDVWNERTRRRYRKQLDLPGVMAYPASVTPEGRDLLVHTTDGQPPRDLWRSRAAYAMQIGRDKVRLRGITFRNYTGGNEARALTLLGQVEVEDCQFFNVVRAMSSRGNGVRVVGCRMREVGLGILSVGDDITVRDCLIESASGFFSFPELNQHLRDGIRIYYPARGATIQNNVTAGFWAGLYIKTASSKPDALPFLIERNTFLDGVVCGSGDGSPPPWTGTSAQPTSRYLHNLIGPNEGANDAMLRLRGIGATVRGNYFIQFHRTQPVDSGDKENFSGPDPFAHLAAGDLTPVASLVNEHRIGARLELPELSTRPWAGGIRFAAPQERKPTMAVEAPLAVSSSRYGAVLTLTLSRRADKTPELLYRKVGSNGWEREAARLNQCSRPEVIPGIAPVVRADPAPSTRYLFDLSRGELAPGQRYEARLEGDDAPPLVFETRGEPRTLTVKGDDLQSTIDRALPGDTIVLEAAVYTRPAIFTHGGRSGAPITLRGAGRDRTFLDGGMEVPILLEMVDAPHLVIEAMSLRGFGAFGVSARNSSGLVIDRCRFQNAMIAASERNGIGVSLVDCPEATLSGNLFTAMEHGALIRHSPGVRIIGNTAFRNLYAAMYLADSMRDAVITHNAFTFTGNDSITLFESDPEAWESATCDFNNYATFLRRDAARPSEPEFPLPERYGHVGSKAIIRSSIGPRNRGNDRYLTMEEWREFSGKDAHSLFADPLYEAPLKGDFRVRAGSPHFLADGARIGAEGRVP